MKIVKMNIIILFCLAGIVNSGMAQDNMQGMNMQANPVVLTKAVCVIYPTAGNSVSGTVTFTKVEGGIKVVADIQG